MLKRMADACSFCWQVSHDEKGIHKSALLIWPHIKIEETAAITGNKGSAKYAGMLLCQLWIAYKVLYLAIWSCPTAPQAFTTKVEIKTAVLPDKP